MTQKEEQEFMNYLESESEKLKERVLDDFPSNLKAQFSLKQEQLLFESMFKNKVQNNQNCEHDILKSVSIPAWKWDEFLSKKK